MIIASISLLGDRKNQQDALSYCEMPSELTAAVVCDGMGGLNAGEIASQTACKEFLEICKNLQFADINKIILTRIAKQLNEWVFRLEDSNGNSLQCGTTLVAAMFQDNKMHWMTVGDSRIGIFRNGNLQWMNRLHNYKSELDDAFADGEISQSEYEVESGQGNALLSYLGLSELKEVDIYCNLSLEKGDLIVLCSDGFYDLLCQGGQAELLKKIDYQINNLPELLEPCINEMQKKMDNASAILVRCNE